MVEVLVESTGEGISLVESKDRKWRGLATASGRIKLNIVDERGTYIIPVNIIPVNDDYAKFEKMIHLWLDRNDCVRVGKQIVEEGHEGISIDGMKITREKIITS